MRFWIPIGLVVGAALLAFIWWPRERLRVSEVPREARTRVAQPSMELRENRTRSRSADTNAVAASLWAAVESRDPARFVANLRELGCPEQTIRDVITFRLCREYWDRLLALKTEWTRSWDYIHCRSSTNGTLQRQQEVELRNALDRDLETLTGVSADDLKHAVFGLPGRSDYPEYLPLEKRAQVRDLELRYRRLEQESRQGLMSWESDPAVVARMNELDRQKQAELAALLTPQELEMDKLHMSPAADYVRHCLPEAKSEAEFRTMVRAAEEIGLKPPWMETTSYDQRYGLGQRPKENEENRKQLDLRARLRLRLTELLGEQRVSELMQSGQTP